MDKNILFKSYMTAVYLRLSKEDEDLSMKSDKSESNSIVNQKALILKEINSMPDTTLYDIYIDVFIIAPLIIEKIFPFLVVRFISIVDRYDSKARM